MDTTFWNNRFILYANGIFLFFNLLCHLTIVVQGELEHRRVKQFYARTNRQGFERQISRHEQRTAKLQVIKRTLGATKVIDDNDEDLPQSDPSEHYHISKSCKAHFDITKWLVDNKEDHAVKVFSVAFDRFFFKLTLSSPELSSDFKGPLTWPNYR